MDLIVFLPIGYFATLIDSRLKIFYLIKAFRIKNLNHYISDRVLQPIVVNQITRLEKMALNDPKKRNDTSVRHNYYVEKVFIMNIVKLIRFVLQILFLSFYIGQYWFIVSLSIDEYKHDKREEPNNF